MTQKKITNELKRLHSNMTVRYLLAISLVALLSIAAFISMNTVIKGMDNSAYLVNVSGKQRMLSQYIALDAYRVYSADQHKLYESELTVVKSRLERNLAEMQRANKMLSKGLLQDGSKIALSPEINELYFGEPNLKYRVQQYLALVRLILVLPDYEQKMMIIRDIEFRSEGILNDLDKVVLQFQKEGEARLQSIRDTKFALLLLTLVVLLLEVLFIFRPMVRHIVALNKQKAETLDDLEYTVAIRTQNLREANKKLERLAHHDALTGLRNRLNLEADIERVILASAKNGAEFSVLMLDVDWFKKINDQYGHDAGDEVLKQAAKILLGCVREGDHVYRAGGEEFVILLNRISHVDATAKAEQIRSAVEKHPFIYRNIEIHKTLSGGLYHSTQFTVTDVKRVLKLADKALYQAKNEGRNRIIEVSSDTQV